jgi:wyosine [tRNA(Phe)-imidazoG37] synthetase (radical SAM superfamily)
MIHREPVFQALLKIEDNILKLDSAIAQTVELLDCPVGSFDLSRVIGHLKRFGNRAIIQTLFVRGEHKNHSIDNTTEEELSAWIEALKAIQPRQVMVYTIDRDTPAQGLEKIPMEELRQIADRVREAGFDVQVSG